MNVRRFAFLGLLMLAAAVSRVLPHPDNVAPIAAVILFGVGVVQSRWAAVLLPLLTVLLSDVLLQVSYVLVQGTSWQSMQIAWGFYQGQWLVYLGWAITIGFGFLIRRSRSAGTIASATLANALVFWVVSNFAVWLQGFVSYPHTLSGLILCYESAIPFLFRSLLGDAFYVTLLFGALALAEARVPALRRPAPAAA